MIFFSVLSCNQCATSFSCTCDNDFILKSRYDPVSSWKIYFLRFNSWFVFGNQKTLFCYIFHQNSIFTWIAAVKTIA